MVYGLRAGLAVIERRPGEVLAVACSGAVRSEVSTALARARLAGVPAAVEPEEQLARRDGERQRPGQAARDERIEGGDERLPVAELVHGGSCEGHREHENDCRGHAV